MPCWRSAAAMQNSPGRGFSCNSLTVAIARGVTLWACCFGALDLSSSPATPSAIHRRSVR